MTIDTVIAFAGVVFLLAIIPGPNALLILYTSLFQSKKHAFSNIVGISVGFLIHAFVSAQGLSLLLSQSFIAFNVLKWLGVAYLLWLGVNNIKSGLRQAVLTVGVDKPNTTTLSNSFTRGLLTNLLNPKIVLFYLSIFPQFVSQEHILEQSMTLGMVQTLVVASWFSVITLFAVRMKSWLMRPKFARWLNYLSGALFVGFGLRLATTRL
ncbi:LysE family translocator [Vibrio vulnificus]|nr:LysE family translocator [Vibrio vulnificus]EHY1119769.1 LysE family translocator [Vibrio vulnificus]